MKFIQIIYISLIILLVGCSGPKPDTELETKISELVEAKWVSAMNTSGLVAVTITGENAFTVQASNRDVLAERLAISIIEIRPKTKEILIAFTQLEPEMKLISYKWKNKDGELVVIQ